MRARRAAACCAQAATGSGASMREAAKIASHCLATASCSARSGNISAAQAGVAAATMLQLVAKLVICSSAGR